jgi:manganese/iron transport system substrate-binding protein
MFNARRSRRHALMGMALLLAGPAVAQPAPAVRDRPLRVVTTFTILQDMAQNVAGEAAAVESITRPRTW